MDPFTKLMSEEMIRQNRGCQSVYRNWYIIILVLNSVRLVFVELC
jgi:hypothetical protein